MFTQTLTRRVLRSPLVGLLTGPHGVDRYTELVEPTWTTDARAKVIEVHRSTPRSVTLLLAPNAAVTGYRAGQHLNLTVEIDGRRHTRCYSPAGAEGAPVIELTIGRHDGGLVSNHLYRFAHPGMVVSLSAPAGDFVLPTPRPHRILFVSGGSGITPVLSMLRTLRAEGHDGEVCFLHYARTPGRALSRRTGCDGRGAGAAWLHPIFRRRVDRTLRRRAPGRRHARSRGGLRLRATRAGRGRSRTLRKRRLGEFPAHPFVVPDTASGGRITFADSGIDVEDDGRPLLDQAEGAGLTPPSGCRMGICHTCTRRKHRGAVRNLTTGAVSTADEEDVQICVSAPVGDVELAL